MLVSLSWLQKYVDLPSDTAKLATDLTMAGIAVERVIETGFQDPSVVVGRVRAVSDHPDADKLRVCRVDTGGGEREIVCGAPNVAEGQLVFVALPGAKLPDGHKIRPTKIRGVKSDGMICSEAELGLGDDHSGIMVLEDDYALGTPIASVLGGAETVLELEITPNRPDLLSHIGVAREIAAITKAQLRLPDIPPTPEDTKTDFGVEIEDAKDCARYVGLMVHGVKVGPSPRWLARTLESVGVHSVNNVVDATNYAMMEMGQPLHAFDAKRLSGDRIVVRRAKEGETLLTLDGEKRELDGDMLVIADAREPVALAGIMGGEPSAVHLETVDILIESANFDPALVRRGRRKLGMSTDASYRFERGVDRTRCVVAAARAAQIIRETAGGELRALVDNYAAPAEHMSLAIRARQTHRILGTRLLTTDIAECLTALGFVVTDRDDEVVTVEVPSHRLDIKEEIDLIEEVARVYGYERIGVGWSFRSTTVARKDPFESFVQGIGEHLAARGFTEVVTTAFSDGRELADFGWGEHDRRRRPIAIRNPLTANQKYLRTSLVPGMLDVVRYNMDHGRRAANLFQAGAEFLRAGGGEQLPQERRRLCLVMTRPPEPDFWCSSKDAPELFVIKSELELMMARLRVDTGSSLHYDFDVATGRFRYTRKKAAVIEGGIIPGAVAERYGFEQAVWYANIDLERLYQACHRTGTVKPLSEFPGSKRDLSLVAGGDVRFDQIENLLVKAGGRLLESLRVFDVYKGDKLADGRVAYGVRLEFRSHERTLTDADVDQIIDKMLTRLKNELDVELRS